VVEVFDAGKVGIQGCNTYKQASSPRRFGEEGSGMPMASKVGGDNNKRRREARAAPGKTKKWCVHV